MTEKTFVDGIRVTRHDNAPDFVLCNLGIKMRDLIEFAKQHHKDGWVNAQIKRSQGGKLYAELDTWEPKKGEAAPAKEANDYDDDIPF